MISATALRAAFAAAIFATTACSVVPAPTAPSDGPFRFTGNVSSIAGGAIAGAQLTFQDGSNKGLQTKSDASGRYAFDGLQKGRNVVTITAPGFVSATPIVDLYQDIDVNFALRSAQ